MFKRDHLKKPDWLKVKIPSGHEFRAVSDLLKKYNLSTVCAEARCPNMHECWNKKSATIMILGRVCTRACRFCSVATGDPGGTVDRDEPLHVAGVIKELGLKYVVITSVDRDDLEDFGSQHYADTMTAIHKVIPQTRVEALIPDFAGKQGYLQKVIEAHPFVLGHNVETVKRLTRYIRDRRCTYQRSLSVLKTAKDIDPKLHTKSGIMVGLGEEEHEVIDTLIDLHKIHVDIVTIGQYLQPTRKHHNVQKYYHPEEFAELREIGRNIGIKHVISGPLVRSSYHASEIL